MPTLNRRHALAWIVPAALPGTLSLAGCGRPIPDVMKIGVLVPLTGQYAPRGKDLLDGAQLAAEQINASGYRIDHKPVRIEIIAVDDKADSDAAKAGAQTLIDGKVHAIIGPLLSPQTVATVPLIAASGTPHLFTTTTTPAVSMGRGNAFRLSAHDDLQGRAMAVFASQNLRGKRIGCIVESGDYGRALEKPFTAALKEAKQSAAVQMEVGTKDEVTVEMAKKLKEAGCDVIALLAREPQLKSLFKSLKEVEHTDVVIVGSNAIRNKNSAKLEIPVSGLFATATAIDAIEFPAGKQFLTAFSEKYKAEPVWGAHYAYDAVFAVTDAARRARSVSAAELIAKLKTIDPMTPVNQQMRFGTNGEQVHASIAIYKAERGTWISQMRSSTW